MRGAGRGRPVSAVRAAPASGPETRTIATPPRPGAVAGAKMVGTTISSGGRNGARFGLVRQQHQPLDPSAPDHMGLKDLVNVFLGLVRVPDALGIDHHRRPQLAPLQAAGGVDTD